MSALDAFQPLSPAEERALGIYDAPCARCGDVCSALSLDAAGLCPCCHDDHQAELDAEDPESGTYAELCDRYDHESDVRLASQIGWEPDDEPRVCACPDCAETTLRDLPLCPDHWLFAPPALRGRWVVTRTILRDACAQGDIPAASHYSRGLLHAEAALVTALCVEVEIVTDPAEAGLCGCGEREPHPGMDTCGVCAVEACA